METSRDTDGSKPLPFIPGTLRRIKLQNFMCHESFELELGSRVNFIIGPNGSGKSALLTAVVVILGGRATVTSRAKRTGEFVKYGKSSAKISLELHNYEKVMDKDKAFKPEEYGKRIIIEKIIYNDERPMKMIIKNEKEKKVSERRQELDEILDHFSIYINNPICILNQEVSKSFLHSKKPEDKFELFMKATNLEQIENDYQEAKETHKSWGDCNNRKSFAFKMLDNEQNKCKEKLSFLLNRVKLQDQFHKMNIELIWSLIKDKEDDSDKINKELECKINEAENAEVDIDKFKKKKNDAKARIAVHDKKIEECTKECEESRKKVSSLKAKEFEICKEKINVTKDIEQVTRTLKRHERTKVNLQESIDKIRDKQKNKDSELEKERRKLEIEQMERERLLLTAKEDALRQRGGQINRSMLEIKRDYSVAFQRQTNLRLDLSAAEASLRSLNAGKESELRKYGYNMQKICDEVELAHKQGRFKKKPYGPMGIFIKVKTPKVAAALEIALGRNASAFTCDNHHDMITLQGLIRKVRTSSSDINFREPGILVRKFCDRHDVSKFKAEHEKHKTLIDLVTITESAVFNALVDRVCLEQVLFIPDYNEARNIMVTPVMIPRGTRCAYTEDCHVMYPRTATNGFRCIAQNRNNCVLFSTNNEEFIKQKQKHIDNLRSDIADAEANYEKIKESVEVQRQEYDSTMKECEKILQQLREMEIKLLALKTTISNEDQPQELCAYESEMQECETKLLEERTKLMTLESKMDSIETNLRETRSERESAVKVQQLKEKELERVKEAKIKEQEFIKLHDENIDKSDQIIKSIDKVRDELIKKLEVIETQINSYKQDLRDFNRPETIRPSSELKSMIRKIEMQLSCEIEENQDPEELMLSLRKRIEEIGQMVSLKDHNQKNFDMTTKSLRDREEGSRVLRSTICGSVSTTFASVMKCMDMSGELTIHLDDKVVNGQVISKAKTLEMSIETAKSHTQRPMNDNNGGGDRRSTRSQPDLSDGPRAKRARLTTSEKENLMTDTRSLSGGERSFSTVAFVLALWHHCQSPFKLMDEIDVFMDMVTRRLSYNALIKFAQKTDNEGQFIYFSPLELPEIDGPDNLIRVFEMPRIVRRGTQTQPTDDIQ